MNSLWEIIPNIDKRVSIKPDSEISYKNKAGYVLDFDVHITISINPKEEEPPIYLGGFENT
jgi:hypothetical protein